MSYIKKTNQTLVFNADPEIPILWSTDNAGNSVNHVFGIIRISRSASKNDDRFYLSHTVAVPVLFANMTTSMIRGLVSAMTSPEQQGTQESTAAE